MFPLDEAERASFVYFENSAYGKDRNLVYHNRNGSVEGADAKSFQVGYFELEGRAFDGWDKHNYFLWGEMVTDTAGFSELLRGLPATE